VVSTTGFPDTSEMAEIDYIPVLSTLMKTFVGNIGLRFGKRQRRKGKPPSGVPASMEVRGQTES
jgi:hypothetical protein